MLKPISDERLDRSGWNLVRLCNDLWRIWENCSFVACVWRARFIREKRVFGGGRKLCFLQITFFFVNCGESSQSKVCSASDARNFGTKMVGIEALWPCQKPESNYTTTRTPLYLDKAAAFLAGPIELISVPIDWNMSCGVPFPYVRKWSRASLTRYGPPNSKMVIFGCFWNFGQLKSMQI